MSTRLAKFLLGWSAAAVAPTETKLETTISAAPNNVARRLARVRRLYSPRVPVEIMYTARSVIIAADWLDYRSGV
jgi:hypothetical protein